jgi:hypothetical protein
MSRDDPADLHQAYRNLRTGHSNTQPTSAGLAPQPHRFSGSGSVSDYPTYQDLAGSVYA